MVLSYYEYDILFDAIIPSKDNITQAKIVLLGLQQLCVTTLKEKLKLEKDKNQGDDVLDLVQPSVSVNFTKPTTIVSSGVSVA